MTRRVPPGACPVFGIARHASSTWTGRRYAGSSNPPLSEEGEREAQALAQQVVESGLLAHEGARIIASPLDRAVATAEAVARATGRRVTTDPDWAEADFGDVEGRTFADLEAEWPDIAGRLVAADTAIDWPRGERHADFQARVLRAFERATRHEGPVLVIAHGFVLGTVMAAALGDAEATRTAGLPRPAGLNVLRPVNGRWHREEQA